MRVLVRVQPVGSQSVLADILRPDGSAAVQLAGTDSLPADLAQEIMSLQVLFHPHLAFDSTHYYYHTQ